MDGGTAVLVGGQNKSGLTEDEDINGDAVDNLSSAAQPRLINVGNVPEPSRLYNIQRDEIPARIPHCATSNVYGDVFGMLSSCI